ncbi:MAG: O-antigen ligase family protein [Gammaproteobacteria bacterium]
MRWDLLRHRFDEASRWMAVATVFSLVVSTALCTITVILFLVFWVASGNCRSKLEQIPAKAVALWSTALLTMLAFGVLYSSATYPEALDTLRSYRELLYIPLLLTAFNEPQWQRRGYHAFLIAMGLTLILSYAKLFKWLPLGPPEQEYTVFKGRIAHSLLMAYAIYLCAEHFVQMPRQRWLWGIAIALGLGNLLFMISGRTGYVVYFTLTMLFMYRHWRWRGLAASGLLVFGLILFAYHSSDVFRSRMDETASVLTDHQAAITLGEVRVEFYANTLRLISKHPLWGGGTGSFIPEYAKLVREKNLYPTNNPHNEFLLIATQIGLIGVILLWLLGYHQWRLSYALRPEFVGAAQGLVVTMGVGSLFNSLLLDFTEGHFYACLTGICYGSIKSRRD